MDDIRKWLNGTRDYSAGVQLYVKHGTDLKMKRLFTVEGESDFKRRKLLEGLQQLMVPQKGVPQVVQTPMAPPPLSNNPSKWPAKMDEVVSALHAQWKPLYAERNDLCARLDAVARSGNETDAGKMAHRILDLDDRCDLIYERRDHYLENGHLPFENKPKKVVVDPVKMAVKLKNAERYVRDFKAKLKKDPANVKAAGKLKEHQAAVIYYKQQLKIDE